MSEFPQITSDQISKIRSSFQVIDQDNDAKITYPDLKAIHESLGITITEEQLNKMMSMTSSEDGINFPTYLSLVSAEMKTVPNAEELSQALEIFSHDSNINADELKESLLKQGMSKEDIENVFKRFKVEKMTGDQVFKGKDFLDHLTS